MQKLTAKAVKQAKPKAKSYKLADDLYLHVTPCLSCSVNPVMILERRHHPSLGLH
jgi:hypothetical protein